MEKHASIIFHLGLLKKVRSSSELIIELLSNREIDSVIQEIQNRERLLNIIRHVHLSIDKAVESREMSSIEVNIYKCWTDDVQQWSQSQYIKNTEIETLLQSEKERAVIEIASIFDKKRRHKGYDLTSLK